MRTRRILAFIFLLLLILGMDSQSIRGAESVLLTLTWATSDTLESTGEASQPLAPPAKQIFVIGRFNAEGFSLKSIDQVTVKVNGKNVPLLIDEASLSGDFGNIQSIRFLFALSEEEAIASKLQLEWGADVVAKNQLVKEMILDPTALDRMRGFTWRVDPPALVESQPSLANITVRAESYADWYALWYLLPIGLVVALLIVRKSLSHERSA
jgi:hypothetical protein